MCGRLVYPIGKSIAFDYSVGVLARQNSCSGSAHYYFSPCRLSQAQLGRERFMMTIFETEIQLSSSERILSFPHISKPGAGVLNCA